MGDPGQGRGRVGNRAIKVKKFPSYTGSEINYLIQAQSGDLINVPADGIKWLPEIFSFSLTT